MKTRAMKRRLRIPIFIFVPMFIFSLFSCGKKVYINEEDLKVIDVYNVHDKLVFQNVATKETDTSIITKKEVYHENYDWLRHDGYQPHYAEVRYKNSRLKYGEDNQDVLIGMGKRKPDEGDGFGVSYLYSQFFFQELDELDLRFYRIKEYDLNTLHTITLESITKTFNKVLIQSRGKHPKHKPKDDFKPQKLYWDKDYGIIKYETYGRDVWERINW